MRRNPETSMQGHQFAALALPHPSGRAGPDPGNSSIYTVTALPLLRLLTFHSCRAGFLLLAPWSRVQGAKSETHEFCAWSWAKPPVRSDRSPQQLTSECLGLQPLSPSPPVLPSLCPQTSLGLHRHPSSPALDSHGGSESQPARGRLGPLTFLHT